MGVGLLVVLVWVGVGAGGLAGVEARGTAGASGAATTTRRTAGAGATLTGAVWVTAALGRVACRAGGCGARLCAGAAAGLWTTSAGTAGTAARPGTADALAFAAVTSPALAAIPPPDDVVEPALRLTSHAPANRATQSAATETIVRGPRRSGPVTFMCCPSLLRP